MIVLDAGVLIGHLQVDDPFHDAATGFLEENEELEWGASAMTVAECLVHAIRGGNGVGMLGSIDRLNILQWEVAPADALGLAEVRATSGLKMPDAIVLYTALVHGAELVTTDQTLARAAEGKGLVTHALER